MMKETSINQVERIFSHLGKELSVTTSAVEAADIILRTAHNLIGWEAGYLILYDPEQGGKPRPLLVIDTFDGELKTISDNPPMNPSENMLKAIENDGFLSLYEQPFVVEPSQSFGNRNRRTLSQLFVPVKTGKRVIGLLSIQSYQVNAYTDNSLETLKALANHCAGALERIWAQEALSQMVERLKALYRAAHVVSVSFDMEKLYEAIHLAVETVMPCDDFVIDGYDIERNEILPLYAIEYPHQRVITKKYYADHGLSGKIVHSGESVLMNSLEEMDQSGINFEFYSTDVDQTQSIVAVPMVLHGKVVGMISAQSYQQDAYTKEDQFLLELLASHAAIAIENARLFAQVKQMADTDPLTGLLTRRKFYELAEHHFKEAQLENIPLSVIVLDIDNFKKMNDEFGHRTGDMILQNISSQLTKNLRETDVVCRYGGEEFVIILADTKQDVAIQIAERIRFMVQQLNLRELITTSITTLNSKVSNEAFLVTVSIGISQYSDTCMSLDMLIDQADYAMYQAKQAGKNSVRIHTTE